MTPGARGPLGASTPWSGVKRAEIGTAADLVFRRLRLVQRSLGGHGDVAVKFGVECLDAVEVCPRDLNWRHGPFANLLGELRDGQETQLVCRHDSFLLCGGLYHNRQ